MVLVKHRVGSSQIWCHVQEISPAACNSMGGWGRPDLKDRPKSGRLMAMCSVYWVVEWWTGGRLEAERQRQKMVVRRSVD